MPVNMSGGFDTDYTFKFVVVGDSGAGKTTILTRFAEGNFTKEFIPTIGVDLKVKNVILNNNKSAKLRIWDTSGQDRFKTITKNFYKGANGFLIVFDVTNANTFRNVEKWIQELRPACPTADMFLCGTKIDLEKKRVVESIQARSLASTYNMTYLETSSLTGSGIVEIFQQMAEEIATGISQPKNASKQKAITTVPSLDKAVNAAGMEIEETATPRRNCECVIV